MSIDISTFLSVLSVIIAGIVAVTNIKRNSSQDNRQDASNLTTLIVKLENINEGINEIKSEMRNMKNDIQDLRDRLIIVEQSVKSAHHRIDTIGSKEKSE